MKLIHKIAAKISVCLAQKKIFLEPSAVSLLLLILLIGGLLGTAVILQEAVSQNTPVTEIERESADESSQIKVEGKKADGSTQEIILDTPDKVYSEKTIKNWFADGEKKLSSMILGNNSSLSEVREPLNLIETLPDTPVTVSWMTEDSSILDWDGIPGDNLPEDGTPLTIYATFSCQTYTQEVSVSVKVFPPKLNKAETWAQEVRYRFSILNKNSEGDLLQLPHQIFGETILWYTPQAKRGGKILLVTLFLTIITFLWKLQENENRKKEREEQLLRDYPDILNQFTLLLGAGLNTRKATARIVSDYKTKMKLSGKKFRSRPAYEEILTAYSEMQQGISEEKAYANFGIRCALPSYKTFSTLLIQNLKKGNSGVIDAMESEAVEAYEQRKRRARVLGEKAGTKLLLPMILMLIIVFVLLLYPAWASFGT